MKYCRKYRGCNGVSLGRPNRGVPRKATARRIPPFKIYRKALPRWNKKLSGFPGDFCDCSDASADLLCQLYRQSPFHATHQLFPRQRDRRHVCCLVRQSAYLSVFFCRCGLLHLVWSLYWQSFTWSFTWCGRTRIRVSSDPMRP